MCQKVLAGLKPFNTEFAENDSIQNRLTKMMKDLLYISYATQLDAGMTHEQAVKLFGLTEDDARSFHYLYIFNEFDSIELN